MFRKELCLTCRLKKKNKNAMNSAGQALNNYLKAVSDKAPQLILSSFITAEPVKQLPEALADEKEAILFVASSSDYRMYAHAITESPVPFLFVGPGCKSLDYKTIVLPVDLRKENSDAALWCSWFGRFGKSEVRVIAANDNSRSAQQQILRNVKMTKNLLLKTNVQHRIIKGSRSSLFNSFEAADYALTSGAHMLVLLGSSTITPLDWLIGLPERKIIRKAEKVPVLLINPRRDNYFLCD